MVSLEDIINDRRSGQSRILRKTIELLRSVEDDKRLEVCKRVMEAHRIMVGLRWLYKRLEEGASLSEIEKEIEKADEESVKVLRDLVDGKTVVTISRSHTLEKGLVNASKVLILESSPAREGIDMARYLKGRSVEVHIFPDCAMGYAVKASDFAVVGVDAVFKNGIINKVGTLPLALCCKHFSKNMYAIAQSYKFADEEYRNEVCSYTFNEDLLFEFVPISLVEILTYLSY